MTTQSKRTVAFALCGSFCSFAAVLPQLRVLTARGWDVLPILSASAAGLDTRFGTASALRQTLYEVTGHRPLTTLQAVEPLGPQRLRGAHHRPGHRHHDGAAGRRHQLDPRDAGRKKPFARRTAHYYRAVHERWAFGQCPGAGPAFAAAQLLFCALRPGRQLQKAVQPEKRFHAPARHIRGRAARRADPAAAAVISGRERGI